ncbi:MAG TPA: SDR family NAD(P)-dependent oxidoreductase [Nitrososphaerales archaeon]|nr:SDR family NAD(P)-dependent oxidoreductase [Nitrososphaerales archaeon]
MQQSGTVTDKGAALRGKVAVVTGGGSGVGKAMSELFAQNGCSVLVVDVVPARVEEVVGRIKSAGGKATELVSDLTDPREPEKMVDHALSQFGSVDILCNNAGIMDGVVPAAEATDELWDRVMAVNLAAPFKASRKVIPQMIKQGGGVILNTASVAGLFGGMAGVSYTVSKHALIGLTRSIAAQYGKSGIRCNAMVLGGVNTNIGLGSAQPDKGGLEHLMKLAALVPRMAEPMEIAELALFLVSSKSSYMNGSCVVIDGGWTVF